MPKSRIKIIAIAALSGLGGILPARTLAQSAPATSPGEPADVLSPQTVRSLIVAIAKWRAEDFAAAGRDLSRLINAATADERDAMSARTRATTGLSLAELAADAHYRAALAARRGAAIRLAYVTEYEKPALIPKLVEAYGAAIRERQERRPVQPAVPKARVPAGAASRPWYEAPAYAQTRPASDSAEEVEDFAVIDWIDRPEEFIGSTEQAKALAPRVHRAASLLNERLRFDPAVRDDPGLKERLLEDKQRLARLSKVLTVWAGRKPPPGPDPQARAREQARRQELQQLMQARHAEEMDRIRQAQENARKWQAEEARRGKGPSLFDWLRPRSTDRPTPAAAPTPPAQEQPQPAPAPQ
ncbi:MAG: hypothetical protein HY718_21190 [Planctomycetes bacterium]|nr:hypothetical protein [Planctomycetota bacterium]